MTEPGVVTGQDEVAHQRQFTAAPQRETVDRGNDRLAAVSHPITVAEQVIEVDLRVDQLRHFLDVSTGGKGFFRAGQYDTADVRIGFQTVQRVVQFADNLRIQCVQCLGTIERDQADPALDVQQNRFVTHANIPSQRLREMTMR
ncbi:hypothetical protein D3C78_1529940 [compost metagenome]